jgi:tRNA threonylcarbamoyladenosine biosynthesis protein TsaB
MQLLALDTSTECCSAALRLASGEVLLRAVITERGHAELILPMIDMLLSEAGLRLADLDGLAFGRGPGAFTGLRVAAGVAQGLAIGAGLRVAPISSLAAVAAQVTLDSPAQVLVCNDARMGEIYWATYWCGSNQTEPREQTTEAVSPPERIVVADGVRHVAGNALMRYPLLQERARLSGWQIHDGLYPRADAIARLGAVALAAGRGVGADQALPSYVRDDVARPSGGPVTGMS